MINGKDIKKQELKEASDKLYPCPFCGGKTEFLTNKTGLYIAHYPASGVNCPARFDQYCDDFEMGIKWWNTRVK